MINNLGDKNWCIFKTVIDTNMKQLENRKEIGNIDCNTSVVSGALITIKVKWHLKCKMHLRLG
jgi:hypothetical protein